MGGKYPYRSQTVMYLVVGECACRTWPLLFGTPHGRCGHCGVVPQIIAGPFTEQEYDQWLAQQTK